MNNGKKILRFATLERGKPVHLMDEFLKRFGGPFNREMFQAGMQEGQDRLNITLMKDPGEVAETEEIFDLLFDRVVDQNVTYTFKNCEALGVIDFSAWPVHPRIWIQGIRNWLRTCTTATGDQLNKATLQIAANVLAVTCKPVPRSLVPQIHHPLVAEP